MDNKLDIQVQLYLKPSLLVAKRRKKAKLGSLGIRDHHRFILNIRAVKLALHWQQEEVLWRETCHQHAAKKMLPLIISLSITMGSVYTG